MSEKIDKLTTGDVDALFSFYDVKNKDDLIQLQYEHITQLQKALHQCNSESNKNHISHDLLWPRKNNE